MVSRSSSPTSAGAFLRVDDRRAAVALGAEVELRLVRKRGRQRGRKVLAAQREPGRGLERPSSYGSASGRFRQQVLAAVRMRTVRRYSSLGNKFGTASASVI